jgi:flagellar M-ring protein FliF
VAVIVRPFQAAEIEAVPFWETAWFGTILRNVVALIAVLLVLFLAVRPIVKALTRRKSEAEEAGGGEPRMIAGRQALVSAGQFSEMPDRERLSAQIELAQRIVREQPDDALQALRRMLGEAQGNEGAAR